MKRKLFYGVVLGLLVLSALLPTLPAGALAPRQAPAELPFDPEGVARQSRSGFRESAAGLSSSNGYRRVELDSWGVTFTPFVGGQARPEDCLRFRLLEIRVGAQDLYSAPPSGGTDPVLQGETTAAYQRPEGIYETYYALDYGVEQVFVLSESLAYAGDLLISGYLSSTLEAELRGGTVHFSLGDGQQLGYGEALVRDAAGRELPLELAWSQGQVSLTVPAGWLAGATYPVEVDPLIGSNISVSSSGDDQRTPAVATSDASDDYRYLVVWADDSSGNWDVYGQLVEADGSLNGSAFAISDDEDEADQKAPALAYDAAADKYLVVWEDYGNGDWDVYGRAL